MGEHEVESARDNTKLREFMRALLEDVAALERMCAEGRIERGVRRIGAEQELFLVDRSGDPAPVATEVLERLKQLGGEYTTELGRFNVEANMRPQVFGGGCLRAMEEELDASIARVRIAAAEAHAQVVMTGILPTLEKRHLTLEYMTPSPRYHELNRVMSQLRGREFLGYIKGVDELQITHDNVMLEACNTSFQVHFQVAPDEFARFYNLAQAVTAPVLAVAVNSPLLLQHRLWHETRVALFQQSLDSRSRAHQERGSRQRVSFGDRWIRESVLEIFRDDVARYRVLLSGDLGEPSMELLRRGETPPLRALCLHNGTVYRWNRPCYGVKDGTAHLRIENRALPAGPTVVDEIANAAFFFGLLSGLAVEGVDVTSALAFDDAKGNFHAAARYGLGARLVWLDGKTHAAPELVLALLPIAREGLRATEVDEDSIERYLGVIEERTRTGRTGAQWMLDSIAKLQEVVRAERYRTLVLEMVKKAESGAPVHEWPLAQTSETQDWRDGFRTVGQFMTTDLFTAHPEDLVDLAASLMEWEHIRYVPVEDAEGKLVGLVSHRRLLRLVARGNSSAAPIAVRDIMAADPVTATPDTTALEAMRMMGDHKVGCLPVVREGKLVGIVTEHDFIAVARKLLEAELSES